MYGAFNRTPLACSGLGCRVICTSDLCDIAVFILFNTFALDDVGVFESLLKYTDNKNVIDAYNGKIMMDSLKRIENVVNDN